MLSLLLALVVIFGPSAAPGALVAACLASGAVAVESTPRDGDLVFVDLDCGPLCDAIEDVTLAQFGGGEPRWSHVGVFAWTEDGPVVVEARGPVRATPWASFLRETLLSAPRAPALGAGAQPGRETRGVTLCMLRPALTAAQGRALVLRAQARIGAPYDEVFRWGGPAWYCSELVATALAEVGAPAAWGAPLPMFYGSREVAPRAFETWRAYFATMKQPIPEGKPGISPLALWRRLGREGRPGLCLGSPLAGAAYAQEKVAW